RRGRVRLRGGMEGEPDLGAGPALGAGRHFEPGGVSVERFQTTPCVAEPYPFDYRPGRAGPVVDDAEYEGFAVESRLDLDPAAPFTFGDAVFDRVLDEWLEDEGGHE